MFLTFSTLSRVDTGFFAKIDVNSNENRDPLLTFCTVTNPCKVHEGHCYHDQQCSKGLKCGQDNCPLALGYTNNTNCCYEQCNEWLDLINGTLTSPNYPENYPDDTQCSWTITAPLQSQRVVLEITFFEVSFKFLMFMRLAL